MHLHYVEGIGFFAVVHRGMLRLSPRERWKAKHRAARLKRKGLPADAAGVLTEKTITAMTIISAPIRAEGKG